MRLFLVLAMIISIDCFSQETAPAPTPAVATEVKPVEEDMPAKKVVLKMLEEFQKMADNKSGYLSSAYSYNQYMKKDAELAGVTSKLIDFYDVCEKSLKYNYDDTTQSFKNDHWAGKSDKDKAYFVSLFQQLIESIVYPIANDYFGNYKMTHSVLEVKGNKVTIRSIVQNKKKRRMNFKMDWFLHLRDGMWRIYDVDVDGERWVPSFRSQFNDVITEKSYPKLIELMQKKLKETKEERTKNDKADLAAAKAKKKTKAKSQPAGGVK